MTLAPHAAAVRGDDYHFIIGWYWAVQALNDASTISVSLEDKDSGNFDDLVIERNEATSYYQIKSSNTAATTISGDWLTSSQTKNGKSPLQHFYNTWKQMHETKVGNNLDFSIVTNRAVDPQNPLLKLKDHLTNLIVGDAFLQAGPKTDIGKEKKMWANHLGISEQELTSFLSELKIETEGGETSWERQVKNAMGQAGLRTDDDAVARGKEIVKKWVKEGFGPQTPTDIRRQITEAELLKQGSTITLVVDAIDSPGRSFSPNESLNWVDLFDGDAAANRRQLINPSDWDSVILPDLKKTVTKLEGYGSKKVYISGAMRLPIWFALGVLLPSVRNWILTLDQRGVEWVTNVEPIPTEAISTSIEINQGDELAVEIALTHNSTSDVISYIREKGLPIKELLTISVEGGASLQSIKSNEHALGWAESARNKIIYSVKNTHPSKLHLFMAAPAGAVALLGYYWNMLPATTVYEHLGIVQGYAPTFTLK